VEKYLMDESPTIRLVVSDLDGTLLDQKEEISSEAIELVRSLSQSGVGFSLISGRPIPFMDEIARTLNVSLPMAACNGAVIFQGLTVLEEHSFALRSLRKLTEEAHRRGVTVLYYTLHESFAFEETPWIVSQKGTIREYQIHRPYENEWDIIRPVKVSLLFKDKPEAWNVMIPLLDEAENRHTIVRYEGRSVEITLKGRTKERGLQSICELSNISIENTMAIGDELNDYGMLQHAGLGVAVGNAVPSIKAQADWVARSGYTEGVVEAIKTFVVRDNR
jgi:Cof subfamily protein (haloacid dehalogenase superfamily)